MDKEVTSTSLRNVIQAIKNKIEWKKKKEGT